MKQHIILIFCIFFLSACQEQIVETGSGSFVGLPQELASLTEVDIPCLNQAYNGEVWIKSFSTIHGQNRGPISVYGAFYDEAMILQDWGPLSISNLTIESNQINQYIAQEKLDILGSDIEIDLGREGTPSFNSSFRIPKEVTLLNDTDDNGLLILEENQELSWEEDENNPYGVIISVVYSPNSLNNLSLSDIGHDEYVINNGILEDSGSAILDLSLFSGIPLGAEVNVNVQRFNCKEVVVDNNRTIVLISHSLTTCILNHDFN